MKFKIMPVILLCAAMAVSCGKKEDPAAVEKPVFNFKVQTVIGNVKIVTAAGEKAAVPGDIVAVQDVIITGKKSITDLTYGSSGVIRISENSKVAVEVIAGDNSADSMINLEKGRVFLTLGKLQNTGFKVKTPTVVASVRGTSFVVSADTVKGAKLAVMKGIVQVTPVKKGEAVEGKSIMVETGQKTDYVSTKTVDQVLEGKKEISVADMTVKEVEEIQKEAADIKIETMKDVHEDIKTEIKKDVIESDPLTLRKKSYDSGGQITKSPVKVQQDDQLKKQMEDEKLAAEKRRQEEMERQAEEARIKAEEEKKKAEAVKKERASNIPTL